MADITPVGRVSGKVVSSGQMKGIVGTLQILRGYMRVPAIEFYTGTYNVTPTFSGAVLLKTKGKAMVDDVTVKKMPQYEVSNDAGGKTLILGDDYYGE